MNFVVSVVGTIERHTVVWPEDWPVPPVGALLDLPFDLGFTPVVRTIEWQPMGDPEEGYDQPYIYMVIGPPRPQ